LATSPPGTCPAPTREPHNFGAGAKAAAPNGATIRPGTKQALVDLLRRRNGATVAEIRDATGWQPHTARAALIGLRKKSFAVRSTTRDDGSRAYLLPPPEHRRGERLGAGPTVFMAKARPDILNRGCGLGLNGQNVGLWAHTTEPPAPACGTVSGRFAPLSGHFLSRN
jgi:hypothetical protein